jgi:hypothetical protein
MVVQEAMAMTMERTKIRNMPEDIFCLAIILFKLLFLGFKQINRLKVDLIAAEMFFDQHAGRMELVRQDRKRLK